MSNLQTALERALPIVAAAYGDQFGVNVVLSGTDAYTDGDTIVLPLLKKVGGLHDVLFGYLAHEASHCRYSDFDTIKLCQSPLEQTILNILEDVRVERLIQDVFPGTQFTLNATWTYVVEQGMSPPALPEQNEGSQLSQYLLHRLHAEVLKREVSNSLVVSSLQVVELTFPLGFFIRLDGLLGKYLDSLTCSKDCLMLARAILKAVDDAEKEEGRNNQEQQNGENSSQDDRSNDANGSGSKDSDSSQQADNQSGLFSDKSADNVSEETSPSSGNQETNSQSGLDQPASDSTAGSSSLHETLINETDLPKDAIEQLRGELGEQARVENGYQSIEIDATSVGDLVPNQGGTDTLQTGILASSAVRSRLLGLLQAQNRNKQSLHTRGKRINGNRLARSATGDLRVFVKREEVRRPDTAVHVLLDTSGSMGHRQDIANQATVTLALAISSIPECDIAVSMFPGIGGKVSPIVSRGQPVRPSLGRFAVSSTGGTPLAEAMLFAARELSTSNRQRKVLIIITDGKPKNGGGVHYMNDLLVNHVDTYAIGIGSTAVKDYFENWTVIDEVKELQSALFSIAGKFLEVA